MYQVIILKSILDLSPELSVIESVRKRKEVIFLDEDHRRFFDFIYNYYMKYNKIPSKNYLDIFFSTEKNNPIMSSYKEVITSEEQSDDVLSLADQQFNFNIKHKIINTLNESIDTIKTSNLSELSEVTNEIKQDISLLGSKLNDDNSVIITMHGQEELELTKKEAIIDAEKGFYVGYFPFKEIEDAWGGIKEDDFIQILSYTGQGKTTLAKKIGYYNAIEHGKNVLHITMEMSAKSIKHGYAVLHSSNRKIFGNKSSNYSVKKVMSNDMTDQERDFYYNTVYDDLFNNDQYGTIKIFAPDSYKNDIDSILAEILSIHRNEMPIDFIVMDYLTLIDHGKGYSDHTRKVNIMVKDVRRFSLSYGIPIINVVQSNRAGYNKFLQTETYDLADISDFSELEKSATRILSIGFTAEMRTANQSWIQCVKDRDGMFFDKFKTTVNPASGDFYTEDIKISQYDAIDVLSEMEL